VRDLPTNEELNTAAVAARRVFRAAGLDIGAELTIYKGIPLGSGIGGSAASAVAGAVAAAEVCRLITNVDVPVEQVAQSALAGERIASGAIHGDNVMPSLLGGLILVDPSNPLSYSRLGLLQDCSIVLLMPTTRIMTKTARAILPDSVRLSSAAAQAHRLANMLDALREEDWQRAGQAMMSDELVEPYRAAQVISFDGIRSAALEAGAFACGLTGSGPAMFALIAPGAIDPLTVGQAMLGPLKRQNAEARVVCTRVDTRGARLIESTGETSDDPHFSELSL
jgi:homoserine kinase